MGATRPSELEPAEPQDALQVGKQHLDLLAAVAGSSMLRCQGERPRHVPSVLMEVAGIFRDGVLGQQRGFSGQGSQSFLLAK